MKITVHLICLLCALVVYQAGYAADRKSAYTIDSSDGGVPEEMNERKITDKERTVFTYFALNGLEPDYEQWIIRSDAYQKQPPALRGQFLMDEKAALEEAFGKFQLDKNALHLEKKIKIITTVDQYGDRYLNVKFMDSALEQAAYLPYPYGAESIALILSQVADFKRIKLNPDQIGVIKDTLRDSVPYTASFIMDVKGVSADGSSPIEIDGKDQWLLLGQITDAKIVYRHDYILEDVILWSMHDGISAK